MDFEARLTSTGIEADFSADPVHVDQLLKKVEDLVSDKCDEKIFFKITLVLRESMNNAIFHGARGDKRLRVGCSVLLRDNQVHFTVRSPGSGFNWKDCIKQNPAGSTCQSGWGLFLIREYSDGYEYNDSGNVLKFWFNFLSQEKQ